jgi:hypothetical protein
MMPPHRIIWLHQRGGLGPTDSFKFQATRFTSEAARREQRLRARGVVAIREVFDE